MQFKAAQSLQVRSDRRRMTTIFVFFKKMRPAEVPVVGLKLGELTSNARGGKNKALSINLSGYYSKE